MIQALTAPAPAPARAPARAPHPITVFEECLALGVSQSGFYAHRHKTEQPRCQQNKVIAEHLEEVFASTYHCYGSPRLVQSLRNRDVRCGKIRVRRLMKERGLCPGQKRRLRVQTTQSSPHLPYAPNVVGTLASATAPGERFHSDILDISTDEGFLFPAATLDAYPRRCAGWCARDNMEKALVKEAAKMAFGSITIHHLDRGSQYASEGFRLLLEQEQILQSTSRKGNCSDNALSESFWATVKTECFDNFRDGIPKTRAQALRALFHYIELVYNRERLPSALGYKSPVQFEQRWTQ